MLHLFLHPLLQLFLLIIIDPTLCQRRCGRPRSTADLFDRRIVLSGNEGLHTALAIVVLGITYMRRANDIYCSKKTIT